jgi:hypothetical protein
MRERISAALGLGESTAFELCSGLALSPEVEYELISNLEVPGGARRLKRVGWDELPSHIGLGPRPTVQGSFLDLV